MGLTRRITRLAILAALLLLLAVAVSLLTLRTSKPKPLPSVHPIRLTEKGGCALNVAQFDGVKNPASDSLDKTLVPMNPKGGLVCRFASILPSGSGGAIASSVPVGSQDMRRLARDLDRISLYGSQPHTCPGISRRDIDVIVFAYSQREDVDVWFERSACSFASNGYLARSRITARVSAEFDVFVTDLEKLIAAR